MPWRVNLSSGGAAIKGVIPPVELFVSASMGADLESISVDILWHDNVGIHFVYTGTPTGEFFADVSNDQENWSPVTLVESSLALGVAGSNFIDLKQLAGRYVRARYVRASGTGTLNAWITAKSL